MREEFEDTKVVIRIRSRTDNAMAKRKKGQKDKRTNNDVQNITHKTKDRVNSIPSPSIQCNLGRQNKISNNTY
jgi:hypothetical protein